MLAEQCDCLLESLGRALPLARLPVGTPEDGERASCTLRLPAVAPRVDRLDQHCSRRCHVPGDHRGSPELEHEVEPTLLVSFSPHPHRGLITANRLDIAAALCCEVARGDRVSPRLLRRLGERVMLGELFEQVGIVSRPSLERLRGGPVEVPALTE